MNLHVAVLTGVVEVAVGFVEEFVAHWEANGWNHVEARDVAIVPGCAHIATSGRDTNLRNQSWNHRLALLWSETVAEAHRVFTDNFLNLVNSMP